MLLTKDEIVAKSRVPTGEARFLSGKVKVRGLTVGEQAGMSDGGWRANILPICSLVMQNADGSRMFGEDELAALGGIKIDELVDVFSKAMELSGSVKGKSKALEKNL